MKKILSVAIVFAMVLTMLPAGAIITSASYTSGYYTYDITYVNSTATATITKYSGPGGNIEIPAELDGYPVTGLKGRKENVIPFDHGIFDNCSYPTTVTIPGSVTAIGARAFYDCEGLTEVIIPDSVLSIGESGFYGCNKLTNMVIPNNVTVVDDSAFESCTGLTGLTIGSKVQDIKSFAFYGCSKLTSVIIPNSVTTIKSVAFGNCTELTSVSIGSGVAAMDIEVFSGCIKLAQITVDSQNITFSSLDNIIYNKDKTILVSCPMSKTGDYIIPEGVATIGDFAFYGCINLTSITIPKSVTSIGAFAFLFCYAMNKYIVDSDNNSFSSQDDILFNKAKTSLIQCPFNKIGNYVIPNTVTEICDYAFCGCEKLSGIDIQDGVSTIGECAFSYCTGLKALIIPDSVIYMGTSAFNECTGIKSLKIGDGLTTIDSAVFWGCSGLDSLTIGIRVAEIGPSAFVGCSSLTTLNLPEGLVSIGACAFLECDCLKEIVIPNHVTTINISAFAYCDGLTKVTFGDHVANINDRAFESCTNLATAYFLGNAPLLGTTVFKSCAAGFTVIYNSDKTGFTNPWYGYTPIIFGNVAITFNANGGTGGVIISMTPGEPQTAPAVTRKGYTFSGWQPSVPDTVPAENTTYTAQWAANQYTVSFNSNGGSAVNSITQSYNTSVVKPANPTKTGYIFAGWYSNIGLTLKVTWPYFLGASNVTFYAKWTANTYTVNFNANGGTVSSASKTVTYGSTYGTLPVPTRDGYVFAGWWTNWGPPDYSFGLPPFNWGTQITGTSTVSVAAPQTLYAKWSLKTYTLTINLNGGTGEAPVLSLPANTKVKPSIGSDCYNFGFEFPPNYEPGIAPAVMINNPVKAGCTFLGLATSPSATAPDASFTMPASDTTLYAVWGGGSGFLYGDLNGDGMIDAVDADMIVNHMNWKTTWDRVNDANLYKAGDLNGDGNVDSLDADILTEVMNWTMIINQATGLAERIK